MKKIIEKLKSLSKRKKTDNLKLTRAQRRKIWRSLWKEMKKN